MALGVGLYVVPLGVVVYPALIDWWDQPWMGLWALLRMGLGLGVLSYALIGPWPLWRRVLGFGLGLAVALWA